MHNRKQFDSPHFNGLCENLGIKILFSLLAHPQANGQVEAVNKIIKHHLKTKLEKHKRAWADQLPFVLRSYKTTYTIIIGETPYSLAFGIRQ